MSDSPFAEFAAGAAIVREGEPARAMYIVESGRVEIRSSSSPQPLAELGPGEVIGEMALLQEQPHSATATARTAVRALCIDQAAFHAVLRENPEVALHLMRQLVLRLRAAEQRGQAAAPVAARSAPAAAAPAPAPAATPPKPAPAVAPVAAPAPASAPASRAATASAATPLPPASAPTPVPASAPDRTAEPARPAVQTAIPPAATPAAPAAAAPPPAPRAATPPPAPVAALPPPEASPAWGIRHAQGEIAMAPQRDEWLIGRPDPATGQVPEIDLGGLDVARSLSRRHARLHREGAQLVLREEPGVANGTWVNGERLAPGAAVPLRPGDRLRFGAVEVEFVAR